MKKRGHNLNKLEKIISFLVSDIPLKTKHKPHKLSGDYTGFWECHIEPDWLLIYNVSKDYLDLARTGTHSDLFN